MKKNTLINKQNFFDLYSFSREIENNLTTLNKLEKKIIWVNYLIIKVNDQVLISKLENQRNNLYTLNKKIEYVSGSIKDFILFFVFMGRFQELAIKKLNFQNAGSPLSSKLIFMFKEKERLYNGYVEGDCFSKALKNLSFESYQCYLQALLYNRLPLKVVLYLHYYKNVGTAPHVLLSAICCLFCWDSSVKQSNILLDVVIFLQA